jgi:hypothetical protein
MEVGLLRQPKTAVGFGYRTLQVGSQSPGPGIDFHRHPAISALVQRQGGTPNQA